jgi:hypothetical protein
VLRAKRLQRGCKLSARSGSIALQSRMQPCVLPAHRVASNATDLESPCFAFAARNNAGAKRSSSGARALGKDS